MGKQRTFKSIEEIMKAYWPEDFQKQECITAVEPAVAGEELGRRVVETFGRELAARLQRKK